jgi:hypothetical protein
MVDSTSSFDSLVAELSGEERGLLLERIKTSMPVSSEPLYPAQAAPGAVVDLSARVEELGIIPRLILFLRGLFSGKSREELIREDELKEIGRRVEQRYPGVIDRRRGLILGSVAGELRELRDSSRFFYDALDRSVERDKGAFYAFLASIELPDTHDRLLSEADPASIAASKAELGGDFDDLAVRAAALAAYDLIFSELSDRGRRAMYQDLRSVLFLKRLSGFLFDRLIGTFREGAGPDALPAASFFDARELLLDLGDILFSMSEPPSTALMEAIFVFADREELGKRGGDAAAVLGADMAKAEVALGKIRSFNASVPLGDLLRLASGDPGYLPRELPGGEDWLATYKAFWRERIEASLDEWRSEHRNKELVAEIAAFVGEPGPAGFANISREDGGGSPPISLRLALSFLDAFYRGPFVRELNRPMKIVLVDGEFYRKDNRIEYTDAYDALLRIPELLSTLDARLGPEGEIGASWLSASSEMGTTAVKRRKMQSVARGAEEEAERVVKRVGAALRTMTLILQGFLKGEAGGRYDSLANLSYIDGKSNKEFLRSLDKAKDRCEKAHSFLAEISGLDLSWDE